VKWDLPLLLLTDIFISVPLLKETVLNFGVSAHWFISHGTERNFTFHIGQWEEITFIGLDDVLIETGSGLRAELITRINVLRW
jgi:hypothetical protein